MRALLCILLLFAALPARAEAIMVAGTGLAMPLVEKLGELYQRSQPGDSVRVILPPLGSGGGILAVASGKADLAVVSRPLKDSERDSVGQAGDLARTPLVLATQGGQRKTGFTVAELTDVYAGKTSRWDDGAPLRLVLRSPYESDTLALRALSPAMDKAIGEALVRKGMIIGENDLDALDLLEKIPGSLGPVTLGLLRVKGSKLTLVPLDGVVPSQETYLAGRYTLGKPLIVVAGKSPSPAAGRFKAFLRTEAARKLMQSYAYFPAS